MATMLHNTFYSGSGRIGHGQADDNEKWKETYLSGSLKFQGDKAMMSLRKSPEP